MKLISYDMEARVLQGELSGIPCYEVFDVPPETFATMQRAASPLDYFNAHIWGNRFEHDSHWPSLDALLAYFAEHYAVDEPVTVNHTRGDGDTPLHTACVWGDVSAVTLLLEAGAPVNARGDMDTTPIYNAVSFGRVRCVSLLLAAGATVDDANQLGLSAADCARIDGNPALLALLA